MAEKTETEEKTMINTCQGPIVYRKMPTALREAVTHLIFFSPGIVVAVAPIILVGCMRMHCATWEFKHEDGSTSRGDLHDSYWQLLPSINKWTGELVTFWKNGLKQSSTPFKEGQEQGLCVGWHPNGKKALQVCYEHGKRNGEFYRWSTEGRLLEQGSYKDGVRIGTWTSYYTNGQIRAKIDLRNDLREGVTKVWNMEGRLIANGVYKQNEPWQGSFFLEEGRIQYYKGGELLPRNLDRVVSPGD